jgi:hypothetical protein
MTHVPSNYTATETCRLIIPDEILRDFPCIEAWAEEYARRYQARREKVAAEPPATSCAER